MKKFIVFLYIIISGIQLAAQPVPNGRRLREIIADKYSDGNLLIGGTTGSWALYTTTGKIMNREFSYVTPENDFKQAQIHPDNVQWKWSRADAWKNQVLTNKQILRMHGPISPQCSNWAKNDSRTPGELEKNMRDFMEALCKRYNGKTNFEYLDVVNETVINGAWHKNKSGTDWEVPWYIIGQDTDENKTPLYIKYAFEIAKEHAPDLKFVFNQHEQTISKGSWNLIKETIMYLRNQGLRVDAIGWQAHVSAGWEKIAGQTQALRELIDWAHANDLEFHVTEQSVYLDGNSQQYFQEQAETYKAIIDILVEKSENGKVAWNTWHIDDKTGWRPDEYPAMFDNEYQPKPAYYAVQLALEAKGDYTTQHQLAIKITDSNQEKIQNSSIVVDNDTIITNEKGEAIFNVTAGLYNIRAFKRHFETFQSEQLSVYSDTVFAFQLDSAEVFYNVSFVIKDSVTSQNLSGAELTFNQEKHSTGVEGEIFISSNPGNFELLVQKNNYYPLEGNYTINSDTTFTIYLTKSHVSAKFRLKDGAQPVNNARVILGNDTVYSNVVGVCNFNAIPFNTSLSYSIEKENYKFITGNLTAVSDTSLLVQMQATLGNIIFDITAEEGIIQNASVLINNESVDFSEDGKARVYNYSFDQWYSYQIISDNFRTYSDSIYLQSDTTLTIVLVLTGLQQWKYNDQLVVYPNPAKNKVFIRSGLPLQNARIYNLAGKLIRQIKNVTLLSNEIQVNYLKNGQYYIVFTTSHDHNITVPLLIQR